MIHDIAVRGHNCEFMSRNLHSGDFKVKDGLIGKEKEESSWTFKHGCYLTVHECIVSKRASETSHHRDRLFFDAQSFLAMLQPSPDASMSYFAAKFPRSRVLPQQHALQYTISKQEFPCPSAVGDLTIIPDDSSDEPEHIYHRCCLQAFLELSRRHWHPHGKAGDLRHEFGVHSGHRWRH
jgi:hypothetical protein